MMVEGSARGETWQGSCVRLCLLAPLAGIAAGPCPNNHPKNVPGSSSSHASPTDNPNRNSTRAGIKISSHACLPPPAPACRGSCSAAAGLQRGRGGAMFSSRGPAAGGVAHVQQSRACSGSRRQSRVGWVALVWTLTHTHHPTPSHCNDEARSPPLPPTFPPPTPYTPPHPPSHLQSSGPPPPPAPPAAGCL